MSETFLISFTSPECLGLDVGIISNLCQHSDLHQLDEYNLLLKFLLKISGNHLKIWFIQNLVYDKKILITLMLLIRLGGKKKLARSYTYPPTSRITGKYVMVTFYIKSNILWRGLLVFKNENYLVCIMLDWLANEIKYPSKFLTNYAYSIKY
jgi:hypothetical protein